MAPTLESVLKLSDFEYELPPDRIAQSPISPRDHSRLMVLDRATHSFQHHHFYDIGRFLHEGDVVVLNATRVFPARLRGKKTSGGKAELLLLRPEAGPRWQALVRGTSSPGAELLFSEGLSAKLESCLPNGEWVVCFSVDDVRGYLERYGEMPLPPYIKRPEKIPGDTQTYQTVFARNEGSVAAPTAGFHFTPELLVQLKNQGVQIVEIVLHVGWGTFRPVRAESIAEHEMLPEHYEVTELAATQLTEARREGRRIVAVGTTATRTLESIYQREQKLFQPGTSSTNLYIYPGYSFQAIDSLITNFHLPHSTPLLLASAFYGGEQPFSLREPYQEAIREGYRFYSYGDAMFIQ
jgi:S-adenosylmethionine:tRNA ribosyltransferase-isomerase